MNTTPNGERPHIALFGRRNAGKSSLINAITGQNLAIVSEIKGTTSDPVQKAMEILPLGPVVLIDTPGLDDDGPLSEDRIHRAQKVLEKTDIALIVADGTLAKKDFSLEKSILDMTTKGKIPSILVLNKEDRFEEKETELLDFIDSMNITSESKEKNIICVSAETGYHIQELKEMIARILPSVKSEKKLVGDLLAPGDFVLLVVPIDESAPKGRLILPQQQVIRDALEAGAIPVVCRDTELEMTLSRLRQMPQGCGIASPDGVSEKKHPENLHSVPRLVITDSQAFAKVARIVPEEIPLTSFSILFSRYKGDLETQLKGIEALSDLKDDDRLLMAEGCTHHRQCGDIGTVKLPGWIREFTGINPTFQTSSGGDFPDDLTPYKLIVHCGGCTLNQKEMSRRIALAKSQGVPIVNYGILIAHLKGVLNRSIKPVI